MTGIIEYVQSKAITGGGLAHFFEFFSIFYFVQKM